jgi:acyl-CoA hydrolase
MVGVMDTYIENRHRVQPNHANNYETAHGGNVMKWMDEVGAMASMRFAGETCVTASINQVDFHRPIPVGDIALIEAYAYRAGRTSVRVRIQAFREAPRTGEIERTTGSYFVYVAVDDGMGPTEVPELTAETEEGRRLQAEALDSENGAERS